MTRKPVLLLFLSAPLAAGALTIGLRSAWDRWLAARPVFVYPESVDLGPREKGEVVTARFAIENPGRGVLIVDGLATSCTCAGVEREVDGEFSRVNSVRIPAGGTAELVARIAVVAPAGEHQSVQIFCRSNDPARPFARIGVVIPTVTGRLATSPRDVVLGTVPVGERVRRVVDLFAVGTRASRVERVRGVPPDRFDVRLLDPPEYESGKADGPARKLVARLEVTARSDRPRHLDGEIEIYLTDEKRPRDRIAVTGEVVSAVKWWPSLVVLPRRVGDQTVYSGEVLVQGREEAPLDIRVVSAPAGLRTDVRPVAGHEDRRIVFVEGRPAGRSSGVRADLRIRLGVRSGEQEEESVDIPVRVVETSP